MAGVARNTVASLLVEIGAARAEYQNRVLRNLKCERIQCDEIWSFVAAKDRNVPAEKQGQFGFGSATLVVATIKCPPNCNDNLSPPD